MLKIKTVITGDAQLKARLNRLITIGTDRAVRKSVRAGGDVMQSAIKKEVPNAVTPGHDNEHIRGAVGQRVASKKGYIYCKVGFNVGRTVGWAAMRKTIPKGQRRSAHARLRNSQTVNHAVVLAAGSKPRRTKSGANRGRVTAGGYIPRAVAKASTTAGQAIVSSLETQIAIEAMKP